MNKFVVAVLALFSEFAFADSDEYIGKWQHSKSQEIINIQKSSTGLEVLGQEIILLVDKKIIKPKKYRAQVNQDGSLRISFFMPQVFTIKNGMLVSKVSTYKRITH